MVDGKYYREKGEFQTVWVGEARSTGTSTDMRVAINYLLLADFQQFGQNTGKAVGVEINERRPAGAGVDQMSSVSSFELLVLVGTSFARNLGEVQAIGPTADQDA